MSDVTPAIQMPANGPRLGRMAMLAGVILFVASATISIVTGNIGRPYAVHGPTGFHFNFMIGDPDPVVNVLAVSGILHAAVGGAVGIWIIAQGIIAIAQNRGRRAGVVAVTLGIVTPIVSLALYLAILAAAD